MPEEQSKLLSRVDFRKVTIDELYNILEQINKTTEKKLNLFFLTNFAFIQGEYVYENSENEEELSTFQTVVNKAVQFRTEAIIEAEKTNDNIRPVNDASFIQLKNVSIRPFISNSSHEIADMILFTDQILGVSFSDSLEL